MTRTQSPSPANDGVVVSRLITVVALLLVACGALTLFTRSGSGPAARPEPRRAILESAEPEPAAPPDTGSGELGLTYGAPAERAGPPAGRGFAPR